jgi:hypothetical protein
LWVRFDVGGGGERDRYVQTGRSGRRDPVRLLITTAIGKAILRRAADGIPRR